MIDDIFDDCFDDEPSEPSHSQPLTHSELKQMSLLDKLERLIEVTRGCKLSDHYLKQHRQLIQSVADDLQLTPAQAVMLCPYLSNPCNSLNYNNLQHYFQSSPIAIMKRQADLKSLLHRRYLCGSGSRTRNGNYRMTEKALKQLCDNKGMPVIETSNLTPKKFMNALRSLLNEYRAFHQIDSDELVLEALDLMDQNPQLELVKAIKKLNVCKDEEFVLLCFCIALVIDGEEGIALGYFDDKLEESFEFGRAVVSGTHPFVKEGLLIPMADDNLLNRDVYRLSEKARNLLLKEYQLPKRELKPQNIANAKFIQNKNIKPKPMFYAAEDQEQIGTLQSLLSEKQLKAIRKRLESANMRKGFNCLFYGLPGTGKTETALQLARLTGRDIVQVDISSMRDKWYGETEKIVKRIFDDYAMLVKQSKRIPILLINEADALLSVRTNINGASQSIEKTENAIQNILLEAMENIDGIMIATTNLTCNLDSAFERRFLYKVEFHLPDAEAKANIWRAFLPNISAGQATTLAQSYNFNGGQIENIARKIMVDHLLFGDEPDMERIMSLCSNEQVAGMGGTRKAIGYY